MPTKLDAKISAFMDQYEDDPHEALAFQIVKALLKSGRLSEAFKWAKHARQSFPASTRAAKLYRNLKRRHTKESLRQAKIRCKRSPSPENLVRFSELLRIAGKTRKAFKIARRAEAQNADNWQVLSCLGKLHFDKFSKSRSSDDGWNAVEYLDRSRCVNAKNYSTLILLVISLTRLGSYEDAQNILSEVLSIAPNDERALSLKKRIDAAVQSTGGALSQGPSGEGSDDLMRVLSLPGCVAAMRFDNDGRLEESSVKQAQQFNLNVSSEVFEAMAQACHLDAQRIGCGELSSCALAGDNWAIDYHAAGNKALLGFFEGPFTPDQVESAMESAVCEVAAAL